MDKYYSITNTNIGKIKHYIFQRLQKVYLFDEWHITPINYREYAIDLVKYVDKLIKEKGLRTVIEVGCGLGEIISHIDAPDKVGYDIKREVIHAARKISKKNTNFLVGTFDSIRNKKIDVFISVNFIHGIEPEVLKEEFRKLTTENDVKYIVVDKVISKIYKYNHCMKEILPKEYKEVKRLGFYSAHRGRRYIMIFERTENE